MPKFSKREFLAAPVAAALAVNGAARANALAPDVREFDPANEFAKGRFQPTVQSLKTYQTPDWFRDAKFGIWAHWGPQAVPRQGDWYARFLYVPGHPHYAHHVENTAILPRSDTRISFRYGGRNASILMR